jgi:hypothetical protein
MARLEKNRLSQQQSRQKKTDDEKEVIRAKQRECRFLFGYSRSSFNHSLPAYERGAHVPTEVEVKRMDALEQERQQNAQLRAAQHKKICDGSHDRVCRRGKRCFSFAKNQLPSGFELRTPPPFVLKERVTQADSSGRIRVTQREVIQTPAPYAIKKERTLKTDAEREMRAIQVAEKKLPLRERMQAQNARREKAVAEVIEKEQKKCLLSNGASSAAMLCSCTVCLRYE